MSDKACGCGDELCGGPEDGFRHQCGGPKEACMVPGCRECGTPTIAVSEAESMLREAAMAFGMIGLTETRNLLHDAAREYYAAVKASK